MIPKLKTDPKRMVRTLNKKPKMAGRTSTRNKSTRKILKEKKMNNNNLSKEMNNSFRKKLKKEMNNYSNNKLKANRLNRTNNRQPNSNNNNRMNTSKNKP